VSCYVACVVSQKRLTYCWYFCRMYMFPNLHQLIPLTCFFLCFACVSFGTYKNYNVRILLCWCCRLLLIVFWAAVFLNLNICRENCCGGPPMTNRADDCCQRRLRDWSYAELDFKQPATVPSALPLLAYGTIYQPTLSLHGRWQLLKERIKHFCSVTADDHRLCHMPLQPSRLATGYIQCRTYLLTSIRLTANKINSDRDHNLKPGLARVGVSIRVGVWAIG